MRVIINQLSCDFKIKDVITGQDRSFSVYEAKALMEKFIKTYSALRQQVTKLELLDSGEELSYNLAKDYPIACWQNDITVDTELRRIYKRMRDFYVGTVGEYEAAIGSCEFCMDNHKNASLTAAAIFGWMTLSFATAEVWVRPCFTGKLTQLSAGADIEETDCSIMNAAEKNHVAIHQNWIGDRNLCESYLSKTGEDLWNERDELFPHLMFCEDTKPYVTSLISGADVTKQIIHRIKELEHYFGSWDGNFDPLKINNVSPESGETLAQFRKEHTRQTPDDRDLLFSWHTRFTGAAYQGRIFFYPDAECTKKGIIGHVGRKLPTRMYPNP